MEDELKAHLEAMEARLDTKIEKVEARLDTKIEAMEARLDAKIEKVETTLLTEFHKWASPAELRARSHAAAIRALDLETEALTERVAKAGEAGVKRTTGPALPRMPAF